MSRLRAPTLRDLQSRLAVAEGALAASMEAVRTHGRQGITWELLKADAVEVNQLKGWIANGNYAGRPPIEARSADHG